MRYSSSISLASRAVTLFVFITLSALLVSLTASPPAHAAITFSGNVSPSDTASWNSSSWVFIGDTSAGSMTVSGGSELLLYGGKIGGSLGVEGVVTVDGAGSSWTTSSQLEVGYYGSGTLSITNGGAVSNYNSSIGYLSSSRGVVAVDGSSWTNTNTLNVGSYGSGTLSITNGATVTNNSGYIGDYSGSRGVVTVDGVGSSWTNIHTLNVGSYGSGTLNIANGGSVSAAGVTFLAWISGASGAINFGAGGGTLTTQSLYAMPTQLTGTGTINARGLVSDVNLVFDANHGASQTVSGLGDITLNLDMSNSNDVGNLGVSDLTIQNGIAVHSCGGYIGYRSGSTGTATVSGPGSKWTNSSYFYVGDSGSGTLDINNGGAVSNLCGYIGMYSGSSGTVTVDGAGSTWINRTHLTVGCFGSGKLNISNGGFVSVAGSTSVGPEEMGLDGTIHFGPGGGTLTTKTLFASQTQLTGTGTLNAHGLVGDVDLVFDATHGASQTVSGSEGVLINLDMSNSSDVGDLGAGYQNAGSLIIQNGIAVESNSGYLGYLSGSTGTATVDGSGSKWTNSSDLYVGRSGAGTLVITNGGAVSNTWGYIGSQSTATVNGSASRWTNSGSLYVGKSGAGMLNINNGGAVSNTSGYVGMDSLGTVTVDGVGSAWINTDALYVGYNGSGTLNIANGGSVSVADKTYIGYSSAGKINFGLNGGTLTTQTLFLSSPTQLAGCGTLNTRGLIADMSLTFDATYGASQTVPGLGMVALNLDVSNSSNVGEFGVGYKGAGAVTIQNGVAVNAAVGYLGYNSGSSGTATVSGVGSRWTNNTLYVGSSGNGTIAITSGGAVYDTSGYLGYNSGSSGAATVSGTGSMWANSSNLFVGSSGTGTLAIIGGGAVSNTYGYLGYNSGSSGTATVSGDGSMWANSSNLFVGFSGTGTLAISGGGTVSNDSGNIGNRSGSKGTVMVDGFGTAWMNTDGLNVGSSGVGILKITNGGLVSVGSETRIGVFTGSAGTIHFGPGGGTLATQTLFLPSPTQLTGTGTIVARGLVGDLNLTFDSSESLSRKVSGFGDVALNLDMRNSSDVGLIGVGLNGTGSLTIHNGVTVSSSGGYLGYNTGSTGTAVVDGIGSIWNSSNDRIILLENPRLCRGTGSI